MRGRVRPTTETQSSALVLPRCQLVKASQAGESGQRQKSAGKSGRRRASIVCRFYSGCASSFLSVVRCGKLGFSRLNFSNRTDPTANVGDYHDSRKHCGDIECSEMHLGMWRVPFQSCPQCPVQSPSLYHPPLCAFLRYVPPLALSCPLIARRAASLKDDTVLALLCLDRSRGH